MLCADCTLSRRTPQPLDLVVTVPLSRCAFFVAVFVYPHWDYLTGFRSLYLSLCSEQRAS